MATVTLPVVDLWISIKGTKMHALCIPLHKCHELAVNPLKWLRFLGYAIYGRQGYLSLSETGPPIEDYTGDIMAQAYYFVSNEEPRLVDHQAINDRSSDASDVTERTAGFRLGLVERDEICRGTDEMAVNCTACHIIPHSKGDNYIANLLNHRSGADNVNDLEGINDLRNGLLLAAVYYTPFGVGAVAFIKTPNYGLSVDDIPYRTSLQEGQAPATRLTLHYLDDTQIGPTLRNTAPNNSDLREPANTSDLPPDVIMDLFYAAAALEAWAPESFTDSIEEMTRDAYYKEPDNTSDGDPTSFVSPDLGARTLPVRGARAPVPDACKQRLDNRNNNKRVASKETSFGSRMDSVMALWMTPTVGRQEETVLEETTTARELEDSRKKVQAWMDEGLNSRAEP